MNYKKQRRESKDMKIYKVYSEQGEAKENSSKKFMEELCSMNGGKEYFFTTWEEAEAKYNSIEVWKEAQELPGTVTTYRYEGKLIEIGDISDEEYDNAIMNGCTLSEIYYDCCDSFDIDSAIVSLPYVTKEKIEDELCNLKVYGYDSCPVLNELVSRYGKKLNNIITKFYDNDSYEVFDELIEKVSEQVWGIVG